jgi:tRNA A-37 threonylcarbamoyl transferase component Bud32
MASERAVGNDRFEMRGPLGTGGNGVVHRVFDRVRRREVALKSLINPAGRELYRFKREFRALADLTHPNLASLYELYTVGDEWMFTMELVAGCNFLEHVRPAIAATPYQEDMPTAPSTGTSPLPTLGLLDEARLRDALGQLADGLAALHGAGKLHRDVKPSNVLVDRAGRVVILDFGLIADTTAMRVDRTHERAVVGTPAYMSPEQASDRPLSDASDWYAVGVMMFEALTGRRVFDGTADTVLQAKRTRDATPPGDVVPGVPPDLGDLCTRLLARDPAARPDGTAVLAALGRAPSTATQRIREQAARTPFVGRADELDALRTGFAAARKAGVTMLVRGGSGMGKSALVRAFLDEVSVDGEAAILEGRCYERESVPFKALDGVIDDLTSLLMRIPEDQLLALVPRDVAALSRVFPVLRRVTAMNAPALPGSAVMDAVDLRRRALDSLRQVVSGLAARRPVVIAIDDLQWGDADSAAALADLIRGPDAPRILLLCAHRPDDGAADLIAPIQRAAPDLRTLAVGGLGDADARTLWTVLGGVGAVAEAAVRDAAGNPMLLAEIARLGDADRTVVPTVDDAVRARYAALAPDARSLLRAVAVAARPIAAELMVRAAALADGHDALAALRMERLVRVRGADAATVEPSHDRIREAVIAGMSAEERRATHGAIAAALADADTGDRELLVEHCLGAGDGAAAARHAEVAAHDAEDRVALHRAADLYALALLHGDLTDDRRVELATRRARSLAAAGRLLEAAVEYQSAASLVHTPRDRRDLQRRGVEQLLRAGHLDRGSAAAADLLRTIGVRMPHGFGRTVFALLIQRIRLRLRGLAYRTNPSPDQEALDRIDLLWSVSSGFTFTSPILVRVLTTRMLRLALDAGDPRRICLALGLEIGYRSVSGVSAHDDVERLYTKARAIADELDADDLRGFTEICAGIGAYLGARFRLAGTRLAAGEELLRADASDMRWQIDTGEIFGLAAAWLLGDIRSVVERHPVYMRAAMERGNVHQLRGLRGWRSNVVWLIADDPATARVQADLAAPEAGRDEPFHLHHYYDVVAQTLIDLYEHDNERAFARIEAAWRPLGRSHLRRIEAADIESHFLRGSAAIAAGRGEARRLAIADACASRLARIGTPLSRVFAAQLRAGVAIARDQLEPARAALRDASAAALDASMGTHHQAAELRLGLLLDDHDGRNRAARATAFFADQGVADPRRLCAILTPGIQ